MAIKKRRLVLIFAALCCLTSAALIAARAQAETLGFSLSGSAGTGDPIVTVIDDLTLERIDEATVSISPASYARNRFNQSRNITVSKPGYSSTTLIGVRSLDVTVFLKPLPNPDTDVIVRGKMGGWDPPSFAGDIVRAGLVFRSLSALDLLHFNVDSVISPLTDTIDVMGPRNVPSNLVLPEQRVFVFFAPLILNKPVFRLPLQRGHPIQLTSIQGEAAVNDIIPAMQNGKVTVELLNKVRFKRVGISETLYPDTNFTRDLTPTLDMTPRYDVTPDRPNFRADVIVSAVTDMTGDRNVLMPTDIKAATSAESESGTIRTVTLAGLKSLLGHSRDIVTVAIAPKGKRLTGIISENPPRSLRPGGYLDVREIPDSPSLPARINIKAPQTGIAAAVFEGTYPSGKTYPAWYVYSLPSAGDVEVSTRRIEGKVHSYSVMQFDFGSAFNELTIDGRTAIKQLRRFTRASAQVKTKLTE